MGPRDLLCAPSSLGDAPSGSSSVARFVFGNAAFFHPPYGMGEENECIVNRGLAYAKALGERMAGFARFV